MANVKSLSFIDFNAFKIVGEYCCSNTAHSISFMRLKRAIIFVHNDFDLNSSQLYAVRDMLIKANR